MVFPLFPSTRGFRAAPGTAAPDIAEGWAIHLTNIVDKAGYPVPNMASATAITVYGVATRTAVNNLGLIFAIPDPTNSAQNTDLAFAGEGSTYGIKGPALNTFDSGFTGSTFLTSAYDLDKPFQFTARFYSQRPDLFSLRVNGKQIALSQTGNHTARAFSNTVTLLSYGSVSGNGEIDFLGTLSDFSIYFGDQPSSIDSYNEPFLIDKYGIQV